MKKRVDLNTQIIVALIAAAAVVISGYFTLQAAREPVLITIGATQTAEAKNNTKVSSSVTSMPEAVPASTSTLPSLAHTQVVTALPAPTGKLLFSEDFETGLSHGFTFYVGNWGVVDDNTGNKVLEQNMGSNWAIAFFGPSNLSDGVIEFRFRIVSGDSQVRSVQLSLRRTYTGTSYIVSYDEVWGSIVSQYEENGGAWRPMEATSGGGSTQLPKGSWVTVRVEVQEEIMKIFINGKSTLTASDTKLKRGNLAIGTSPNLVAQFDDFKVWEITP